MASDPNTLGELIHEIHWLSAELKRRTALRSEQQQVLVASKGLLNTLAEQGPRTVPAIAEARNTSRQNIQIIANRLAELGCIEFVPNPHHKKSDLVRLTPSGTALLKSSTRQENAVLNGVSTRFDVANVTNLLGGLKQFRAALINESETRQGVNSPRHSRTIVQDQAKSQKSDDALAEQTPGEAPIPDEPGEDDSLPVNLL